jgi:enoyl-CoA hydratase/carnithine racemase
MSVSSVRFEQQDTLGRIVLASPPYNFVGSEYNADLITAVHDASESDVRALLISAEGPNFSVGGAVHEWPDKTYRWFRTFIAEVTNSYRAIEALPIPVVAAIRGETCGGGLELALSADFIVASENAVLWCPEIGGGGMPLAGGFQRLASLIGPGAARRLVILGERTPITHVPTVADFLVADDKLDQTALELATRLSKGPTRGYAAVKSVLKAWSTGGIPAADKLMLDLSLDATYHTEDSQGALVGAAAMWESMLRGEAPPIDQPEIGPGEFKGR